MKYAMPNVSRNFFTAGKLYRVTHEFHNNRVIVNDDNGNSAIVRVDGERSAKLDYDGKFEMVDIPEPREAMQYAASTAAHALADEAESLAGRIKIGEAYIGGAIITSGIIKDACVKDGQIYKMVSAREHTNEYAEVLEQLREILRVPEGENIVSHAKAVRILADGLIALQK
ncbi:MAG: hypothetical protein [Bacteriophage sp.]|nr:MAG: hypothetical protein [Bacteriophage sp.]